MKKAIIIILMLLMGFISGIVYSIYSLEIISIENNVITIKILNSYNYYNITK